MSNTAGDPAVGDFTPAPAKRRSWRRRVGRMIIVYVVAPYVGLCLLLAIFQRSLMYVPTRDRQPVTPADAGIWASAVETIHVETDDGLTLNGWHLSLEEDAAPIDDRWLVLYFHGNAGNRRLRADDAFDFCDVGFDVFLFDYRGYGDNPGSPSESKLVADAHAVWRLATEERGYDPQRVLLYGESLGGGVATRLASDLCRAGTPPAGLFVSSTFSSMTDAAGWNYPFVPVSWLLIDRWESARWISEVSCPILAVHGEEDRIVPIELGRKLFDAAPETSASGVEKRFHAFPNRGHNDLGKSEFTGLVREWVDEIEAARRP